MQRKSVDLKLLYYVYHQNMYKAKKKNNPKHVWYIYSLQRTPRIKDVSPTKESLAYAS